jgi:type I restriction enzyme S subunit
MKDSGIEWMGEIPEHWTICKFRRVIDVLTDFTANGSFGDLAKNVKYLSEQDYSRLVRLTDLRLNIDNEDGVWLDETSHNYLKKSELFGGELLMANVGAYAGYTCIMPHKKIVATLGPNMYLIRVNNNVTSEKYMNYLLGSKPYFSWLQMLANASAQPKINKDTVKSLSVCIPESIEDQERIISYLASETSKLDARIAKRRRQIELLQEYKQALITDAVTGKIDVREYNKRI